MGFEELILLSDAGCGQSAQSLTRLSTVGSISCLPLDVILKGKYLVNPKIISDNLNSACLVQLSHFCGYCQDMCDKLNKVKSYFGLFRDNVPVGTEIIPGNIRLLRSGSDSLGKDVLLGSTGVGRCIAICLEVALHGWMDFWLPDLASSSSKQLTCSFYHLGESHCCFYQFQAFYQGFSHFYLCGFINFITINI